MSGISRFLGLSAFLLSVYLKGGAYVLALVGLLFVCIFFRLCSSHTHMVEWKGGGG